MAKCLIAGLPAVGKSTYIGALSYVLLNPVANQRLEISEGPEDLSYLNKLIDPWLSLQRMERTTRGFAHNIDFSLMRKIDNRDFSISLPDIAGEDYESIVNQNSEIIKQWSDSPDSLLVFINGLQNDVLKEQIGDTVPLDRSKEPPLFSIKDMSPVAQNLLLIKELNRIFHFEKLALGVSAWDKFIDSYINPVQFLRERAPLLHNFIMHYFPNAYIFGVSAQGGEYEENEITQNELIEKTENGTRAYVIDPDGKLSYDLTLPLDFLIS